MDEKPEVFVIFRGTTFKPENLVYFAYSPDEAKTVRKSLQRTFGEADWKVAKVVDLGA